MAELKLEIVYDNEDEDEVTEEFIQQFQILNDFLQPTSTMSADEAARRYDKLAPLPSAEDTSGLDMYQTISDIFSDLFEIVVQIPGDHESQDKLISLLKALQALPTKEVRFRNWYCTAVRLAPQLLSDLICLPFTKTIPLWKEFPPSFKHQLFESWKRKSTTT